METPAPFWTVRFRFGADWWTMDPQDSPLELAPKTPDLIPRPAKEFFFRHKAVAATISALLDGAEAVEIERHPPLSDHNQKHDA